MTITISTALSVDDAATAYAAATPGEKARMRTAVTDAAMAAVMAGDMETAAHYGAIRSALKSATPATPARDYVGELSDMAATLEAAAHAIRTTGVEVDGVTYRGTRPGVVGDTSALTTPRPSRAKRSANGTVAAFIAAHVTDTPRTIAQLLAAAPVDAYRPSTGAIGACLVRVADGAEEVDGWTVADVDGRRGAVAV